MKEQQQQDTQTALLLKGAVQGIWDDPKKTAIVTANGHVTFTAMADPRVGMKFTLEQWSEIVAFVGKQTAPAVESWEPNWAEIPKKYKFVAADKDGKVFAYKYEPERLLGLGCWMTGEMGGSYSQLDDETVPDGIKWTETLRTRPGVSL